MNKTLGGMSVAEAAALLKTSSRQLTRLIQRGEFTNVFTLSGKNGAWVLDRDEVLAKAQVI